MYRDRINFIKSKWNVLNYARQVLGFNVEKDGDRTISLAPDSENPTSLIIHEDTWHDFKTGKGGDVIDLCAWAKYDGDKGEAIRELSEGYTPENNEEIINWKQQTKKLFDYIYRWHKQLRPEDYDYLHSRGINDATIHRLFLGYSRSRKRIMIPYFKNGRVCYFAGRDRSGIPGTAKYVKAPLEGIKENVPWGLHTLEPDHRKKFAAYNQECKNKTGINKEEYLIIAEGAFDAMSFEQEGFKVLSPLGGFFNRSMNKFVVNLCKSGSIKHVFICFDNDGAGNRFNISMGKIFFAHRINFLYGVLPEKIKDVSDYYAAGNDLIDLIKNAVPGIEILGRNINNKQEFRDFVAQAARFCDSADLSVLFSKSEINFDREWLSALKQQVTKCPSDVVIINALLAKRKLRYLEKAGYYEYCHGVWLERSENFISGYLVKELGRFASGTRLSSLHRYLRSQITSDILFNRQNIFNFMNGVLMLDSGELKAHSESYNSSIQVNYNYSPEQDCPNWKKFIAEIMNNDASKMNLLQEMAGYILFPDLRMQKCFFLMGEGGNGKSVFINVLRQVFGEDNCSSVQISNLRSEFEPIRLLNSLANFTNETDTNLRDAEARFKAIVTGDRISACYKGKDFIEFNPRAVMICACNKFINSADSTRGFLRRIIFINFTRVFEGKSDNKNLTSELCQELPGIFNWCYDGYKRLMQTQEFTQTSENTEMLSDFTQIIDPVSAFYHEELASFADYKIESRVLYLKYAKWCEESGHKVQSRQRFMRGIKQIIKREKPESIFSHSGSETTIILK